MHFMLLIRIVPSIRTGLVCPGFPFDRRIVFSLSEAVVTLLCEGLLSNSGKSCENGSFLLAS